MLGGHIYELVIVLIIALVVFGPKRLPELGSSLGKGIREFRKATNELQDSINVHHSEPLPPEQPRYTGADYVAPTRVAGEPAAPAPAEYTAAAHAASGEPQPPRA